MAPTSSSLRTVPTAIAGIVIASALAAATTYYYWLLIKPRRKFVGSRGKTLISLEEVNTFTNESWLGTATRIAYLPFITAVKLTNQQLPPVPLPLRLGSLTNLTELDLSGNGLESFPEPILQLFYLRKLALSKNKLKCVPAEIGKLTNLEDLDLGRNELELVPREIGLLQGLRFLNLMANRLTAVPDEIGDLKVLYRLGLKSNKLKSLPASMGAMEGLVELFLTDNELETLPAEFGNLKNLFKLQASFNRLSLLPPSLGSLPNLELFRIAVNEVAEIPPEFARLDRLAWFSLAGNPACAPAPPPQPNIHHISFSELELGDKLGDGASGDVFLGRWREQRVAFKQFKAETSPDGHSRDEIAVTCALDHPALIKVRAVVDQPSGLVMDLLAGEPMAEKPNFDSLLRCRWAKDAHFSARHVVTVGRQVAGALAYLHSLGICHGDVYAHNIVADKEGNAVLCDYGASFCYKRSDDYLYEAQEVRAFGLFLADLVSRVDPATTQRARQIADELGALVTSCTQTAALTRPLFGDVSRVLDSIAQDLF